MYLPIYKKITNCKITHSGECLVDAFFVLKSQTTVKISALVTGMMEQDVYNVEYGLWIEPKPEPGSNLWIKHDDDSVPTALVANGSVILSAGPHVVSLHAGYSGAADPSDSVSWESVYLYIRDASLPD